jgi:hypothetical protein
MTPKRAELLYGALFLGILTVIALLFGLYPTVEIPPDAAVRTIAKVLGAASGALCIITGLRALSSR